MPPPSNFREYIMPRCDIVRLQIAARCWPGALKGSKEGDSSHCTLQRPRICSEGEEFSQAELQKSEADIADTDAKYQYRLTLVILAYTISSPK